ncbi:hypothetical protein [Bifidobacterium saguinibicoloris]|uniref:hypothetical protein n=1 Tax=Bifidobacterium saguinibicoloris TaxID=2834433 RepID=UPI001C595EAC|nr:hypothetical protein [Bifidobacterium saguinibicoloris]MBW3081191.1 hypothetical protein [Bifidobacterium saguinibicoloris]
MSTSTPGIPRTSRLPDSASIPPFSGNEPAIVPRLFTPCDRSDYLLYLALLTLPVDGTTIGFFQPFWTPISPWLLLVYCLANPGLLRRTIHRYAPFLLLPIVLIYLSAAGWAAFGVHNVAIMMSLSGVIAVPATMCALDIAFIHKHLDWSECVRIVIAAYWFAFGVGIIQWLGVHLHIDAINSYFNHLMYRSYSTDGLWGRTVGRPQFLFAEPSYIGMHLFGILLPLHWLMRSRDSVLAQRLCVLIVVFAVGSVAMGSGTRIVLDCLIALIIIIVIRTTWHDEASRKRGILMLLGALAITTACFTLNSRLDSILDNGMEGDGSFFARIWQPLGPLCGLIRHPWTMLTGYGAGNIAQAAHQGATLAVHTLTTLHTNPANAAHWYATTTPDTVWTMCLYANFLIEFGLIGFALLFAASVRFLRRHQCAWNKTAVCWLILLVYLYIQFEGYAFAAFPLFIWVLSRSLHVHT